MSKAQYDLSTPTNYLKRTMFLDPAGPVTVQRFEEYKYPKIANFEQQQRGFFWVPEEISLTKDSNDFKDASDAVKHIFTSNLLRQTALDSLQGRGPVQVFSPVVSLPELESLVLIWSMFETNIHSKSYSHIIRNIYGVPKDVFNTIHDTKEIVDMASSVGNYYDALHLINCRKETGEKINEKIDLERADYWLSTGAIPSETVEGILKRVRSGVKMSDKVKVSKPSKKAVAKAQAVSAAAAAPASEAKPA